jgi:hypothetical protein
MKHPDLLQYETTHHVHFYGSKVTCTRAGWRCFNEEQTGYIRAPTLDQLVHLAPHCIKHKKQPKQPKQPYEYKPTKHPSRRNKVLARYEKENNVHISGFNVTFRKDHWTCLNENKTASRSFESLESLLATCPYVINQESQ